MRLIVAGWPPTARAGGRRRARRARVRGGRRPASTRSRQRVDARIDAAAGSRAGAVDGRRPALAEPFDALRRARARRRQAAAPGVLPLGVRRRRRRRRRSRGHRRGGRARAAPHVRARPRRRDGRLRPPGGADAVHRRVRRPPRRRAAWRGEARRFGEGVAILVGDLAFVYADMLLAGAPPTAIAVFDELRIELNVGQYLDLRRHRAAATATRRRPGASRGTSRASTPSSGRCTSAPRWPAASTSWPTPCSAVRRAARRGVPAPRRPARRVRRRVAHGQAGRRRPARGQADPAARDRERTRAGRPSARCSSASARPTSTTTRSRRSSSCSSYRRP